MNHKIKLQMRKNYVTRVRKNCGTRESYHCVYQIQIPIALIRELGWKKGNVLILNSPSASHSISMRKRANGKS